MGLTYPAGAIALAVGHSREHPGAVSTIDPSMVEFPFLSDFGKLVLGADEDEGGSGAFRRGLWFRRDGPTGPAIRDLAHRLNMSGCLLVVELHFDSGAVDTDKPVGPMGCYFPHSQHGFDLANDLARSLGREMYPAAPGAPPPPSGKGWRLASPRPDLELLRRTAAPAVILELFHGRSSRDVAWWSSPANRWRAAQTIVRTSRAYLERHWGYDPGDEADGEDR